jgi:hypothetical protein
MIANALRLRRSKKRVLLAQNLLDPPKVDATQTPMMGGTKNAIIRLFVRNFLSIM